MNIWVRANDRLYNLSMFITVWRQEREILGLCQGRVETFIRYKDDMRAIEVFQSLQNHINAIGTNNFNNLPMVFEMPIE